MKVDPKTFSVLMDDKRLSLGAFKLWHALYGMIGKNVCCWPSIRTLADKLNADGKSVQKWLKELADCKYIRVQHGDSQHANKYFVAASVKRVGNIPTRVGNIPSRVGNNGCARVGNFPTELTSGNLPQEENGAVSVQEMIKALKEAAK